MPFEIGQKVGDYEVVRMLGVGGMGHVYQVRNVISNRNEAMKVLLPDLVAQPDLAARFTSEIRTLASFDHPNIAQLHTAFQFDNQLIMMMEFVEGSTLEQRAKQGPLAQNEVINYIRQVLSALSYAHGRGVVHRDIKPANIMVTAHGVAKLMDFGIAKSHTEMDLTRPGTTMGSLYYMSPEQVRGGTIDARSDIYSVGITMYELLAGRRPFEASSAYAILNQQCNVAPQPPMEVNQELPRALSDLILCMLAKDPANRFQNAEAVNNALRQIAAAPDGSPKAAEVPFTPVVTPGMAQPIGQGISASAPAPPRVSSGHRAAWVAAGALAVGVAVAGAAVGLPHFFNTHANISKDQPAPAPQPPNPAPPAPLQTTPDAGAAAKTQSATTVDTSPQEPPAMPTGGDKTKGQTEGVLPKPPRPRYQPPYQGGKQNDPGTLPVNAPQPENAGPTAEEVDQARDEKTQLDARAGAVSASLESLKRQQEADGLGLRQDMAAAYSRMNSDLSLANAELESGKLVAARRHMDMADKEISTLEGFFGHK